MGMMERLRKMLAHEGSLYSRAALRAAESSTKRAVRGRISAHELKDLRGLSHKPEQSERILAHIAKREEALKKISFVTAWRRAAANIHGEGV